MKERSGKVGEVLSRQVSKDQSRPILARHILRRARLSCLNLVRLNQRVCEDAEALGVQPLNEKRADNITIAF